MEEVRKKRNRTRVTSKNQVTLPVEAMAAAGLKAGDRLVARADGPGRVIFEREDDPLDELSGALKGVYGKQYLRDLRDEWD